MKVEMVESLVIDVNTRGFYIKAKILTLSPEPLIHLLCQDYFASLATWNDHFGQFHEQPEKCKNGKKGLLSQWEIRPHIYGVHMEGG